MTPAAIVERIKAIDDLLQAAINLCTLDARVQPVHRAIDQAQDTLRELLAEVRKAPALRVIVREQDAGFVAGPGAPHVEVRFYTFDIVAPDVAEFVKNDAGNVYSSRSFVGVELLEQPEARR